MSGFADELDADQKAMLEQIRENLSDLLTEEHDDRFLLQFLRARLFHVGDAEEMLRAHLRWRKHFSVEYLMEEYKPPEYCEKYLRLAVLGFTNDGSLIRILHLGYSDLKGVLGGNTGHDIETFLGYILTTDRYLLKKHREQTGLDGETVIYIGDFKDINVYDFPWKYTLGLLIRLVKMFEGNFPEHLKAVHLINCPALIYYVLKLLKPFMSEITASKISIYGTEGYQNVILQNTNPEILPDYLGGTRSDTVDDKTCIFLRTKTDKIPEDCYFYNARRLSVMDPGVIQVKLERRKSLCIDIEVFEENYAIIYEVDVQDHDLGIGIFFRTDENSEEDLKCVKPAKRHKAIFSPLVGMHICEYPGKYVLMMDNSYSYFTEKTALYRIKVKPPLDGKQ